MHVLRYYIPLHRFGFRFSGAPQVLRYSVAKEGEAVSGRDVWLEMEVCSDPIHFPVYHVIIFLELLKRYIYN